LAGATDSFVTAPLQDENEMDMMVHPSVRILTIFLFICHTLFRFSYFSLPPLRHFFDRKKFDGLGGYISHLTIDAFTIVND
jgi:hypothetical protein